MRQAILALCVALCAGSGAVAQEGDTPGPVFMQFDINPIQIPAPDLSQRLLPTGPSRPDALADIAVPLSGIGVGIGDRPARPMVRDLVEEALRAGNLSGSVLRDAFTLDQKRTLERVRGLGGSMALERDHAAAIARSLSQLENEAATLEKWKTMVPRSDDVAAAMAGTMADIDTILGKTRNLSPRDVEGLTIVPPSDFDRYRTDVLNRLSRQRPDLLTDPALAVMPVTVPGGVVIEVQDGTILIKLPDPVLPTDPGDLPGFAPSGAAGGFAGTISGSSATTASGTGEDATFLSTVALHDDRRTSCSGVLVGPRHILTAAHCVSPATMPYATVGERPKLSAVTDSNTPGVRVSFISGSRVCYGGGAENCTFIDNATFYARGDLALVTLEIPLVEGAKPAIATLGKSLNLATSGTVKVVGFGDTQIGITGTKFQTDITLDIACTSMSACRSPLDFVAASENGADSCNGDSGGGVYAPVENGRYVLVGITSRALVEGCGPGGVYVSVVDPAVRTWLTMQGVALREWEVL